MAPSDDDLKKLREQLENCENLLRQRTRQMFFLMKVSEQIARTTSLPRQLKIVAEGIVDAKLFRRAVISIFGRNWKRKNIGYAGIDPKQARKLKKNQHIPPHIWEQILSDKYRISESYYIPHDDPLNKQIGGISPEVKGEVPPDGWHPDDFLFVPLRSHTGRIIGVISVDEPFDGKKPTQYSETLLLLELFAREAAELIERNQLLLKLRNQHSYLRKLIMSSADIVVTTDRRGRIKLFNPAAQKILGYSPSEVRGRSVLMLYKDPQKAREVMKMMRQQGGFVRDVEVQVVSKSGEVIPISLSASILYDEHHQEIGTVGVSRDLRPLKELEKVRRLSTISKIAITLSHYIRTHLMAQTSILYNLMRMAEQIEDETLRSRFVDGIKKSIQRSLQIGKILSFLQNPPEDLSEEKYIDGLEMFALSLRQDVSLEDAEILSIPPLKILVVDDEEEIREGVAEFLNSLLFQYGLSVDTAASGEEAIEKIARKDYDLIITDLKMGEKSGLDVYVAAKEKNPDTQVIVMTAFHYLCEGSRHWFLSDQLNQLKRENVFIFDKPFDFAALVKRINHLFR